jgi:hypothetical protein
MTEDYEAFYARVSLMPPRDQEKLIREAALLVELKQEEVEAFACFAADPNGIPYDASNLKNLGPREIHEIIVAVCVEISKIKVDLISDGEKKN